MNKKFTLMLVISAVLAPVAALASAPQEPPQACYDLYQPVCAAHQVECFAAPCYPVYKTYSNSCFAGLENAAIIHEGECTASETGPIKPAATTTTSTSTTVTSTSTATSSSATTTPPVAHSFLYRLWHAFLSWFTR